MDWYNTFKLPNISDSTVEKHMLFIRNHIKPHFKSAKLLELDAVDFQKYFNSLGKKICLQSIKHIKQLINQFYLFAVKKKLISDNPINDIRSKSNDRQGKDEGKMALSEEMRVQVLTGVLSDEILMPIITVLTFTGLRPGELIALKWENVDLEQKRISVKQSLILIPN